MALDVQLLGQPAISRDGVPVRLSGRKPWALLTFLLLERHPTRREVAARLVPEANDPLGALRWLLHQARRAIEPEATIVELEGGLELRLTDAVSVDLIDLLGVPDDVDAIEQLVRGELLEGMDFEDAPAFEMWLSLQRTRVHDVTAEALWWIGSRLGTADPARALRITERALLFDPFCETTNELLLDLLVQSGNAPVARQRFAIIERRFREELGVPPSETVRRPLQRPRAASSVPPHVSAPALLESAAARLRAGELDRAVETSRRAADVALALSDPELELSALLLLARTLIHSHRGRDQEAKGLLTRALQLAGDIGDLASLAEVECEMGFVFAMEGTGALAEPVLARSIDHAIAAGEESRAAKARTYLGMCLSDRCDYERARSTLEAAVVWFSAARQRGWQGYAEAMLARSIERSGDPIGGSAIAQVGLDHVRRGGWRAVLPWPILVLADCALAAGDRGAASARFSEGLTFAAEIGDPCYQALALRGLGLLQAPADLDAAIRLLGQGLTYCRQYRDVYPWARAVILTDLVELQDGADHRVLDEALELAALGPLPDLAERLAPYRPRGTQVRRDLTFNQTPFQTADT
jgi:DNA-binding SARP family transcriptional activator